MSEVKKVEMFVTPLIGDGIYDLLTAIETSAEGQKLVSTGYPFLIKVMNGNRIESM